MISISAKGKEFIKGFEALSLRPYLCPAGVWTIGYGHTNRVTKDTQPISEADADGFLIDDIATTIAKLPCKELARLQQHQQDAIISFAFNLGPGAYAGSTLRKVINENPSNHAEIKKQFLRWVYAGGKKLPGLVRRREAEANMFCYGLF